MAGRDGRRIGVPAIARALLSVCPETVRIAVAAELLQGVEDPAMAVEVMAAGREAHARGVALHQRAEEQRAFLHYLEDV